MRASIEKKRVNLLKKSKIQKSDFLLIKIIIMVKAYFTPVMTGKIHVTGLQQASVNTCKHAAQLSIIH